MFKIVIFGYKLLSQAFLLRYRDQKSVNKLGIENKNDYNSKITESKFYTYKSSS